MDLLARLANLKKKVMLKIAEAAGAHDTKLVASYSTLANRMEDDERALNAAAERIGTYEKELSDPSGAASLREVLDNMRTHARRSRGTKSERSSVGREEGSLARRAFLDAGRNRGYHLVSRGKTVFETANGYRVAIPFANEQRPDRWFLGISDEKYDVVVLLCQQEGGELFDFVLPEVFLEKFWLSFSRSGGQVKFNVSRSGGNWSLLVPGYESQAVDGFLGAYGPLRN